MFAVVFLMNVFWGLLDLGGRSVPDPVSHIEQVILHNVYTAVVSLSA